MLPLRIGYNGVQIERQQETVESVAGQHVRPLLSASHSNEQGYLGLRTIAFEGYEDQRQERSQL